MPQIADTLDELTAEWFTEALREGGTLAPDTSVTSAASRFIGTGQLGSVALAELEYDAPGGPSTLIIKQPSRDDGSRQVGVAVGVYEAEVRFYQDIAPLVGVTAPRMHWGAVEPETGRFTLVLDDLSQSATVGDMVAGGTVEQAALALSQLVELQAPCWNDPQLLEHTWLADLGRTEMLFAGVEPAIGLFTERFGDRLESEQLSLIQRLAPKAATVPSLFWKAPMTVAHGDYRLDNMMFGTAPGAPPLAIIDWQATRLGPPLLDAAIFLGSCLDTEDRRANQDELLRGYHDALCDRGVKDFSFEDCLHSLRHSSFYPLLIVASMSVTLEQTERGDAMWARLARGCADLALDLDAADLLD